MSDEIFKISKNPRMSKSLLEMARERLKDIKENKKTYKIVEEYYEIIKELITALMYSNGVKTLSHKMLIYYLEENYQELKKAEIVLIDNLRRLRNEIVYYGQKVEDDYLINNEKDIKSIINKLIELNEKELK